MHQLKIKYDFLIHLAQIIILIRLSLLFHVFFGDSLTLLFGLSVKKLIMAELTYIFN